MSAVRPPSPADDQLRRFLLGQLDEPAHQDIERACLDPDGETFAELEAAEDDLRADYAADRLTREERERFADRHLATRAGRERQAFINALADRARVRHGDATADAIAAAPSPAKWWRRPAMQVTIAAAALVLLAVSAVLLGTVHGLQRRLSRQSPSPQGGVVSSGGADEAARLRSALADEQARTADLSRQLAAAEKRTATPMLALWLTPGLTRAAGGMVPRVAEIEVGQGLRVHLSLPADGALSPIHVVALRDENGRAVWTSAPLTIRDRAVTVTVPGTLLTIGDYELVVRGGQTVRTVEDVAGYPIRITR
jgi:hypothetical protein